MAQAVQELRAYFPEEALNVGTTSYWTMRAWRELLPEVTINGYNPEKIEGFEASEPLDVEEAVIFKVEQLVNGNKGDKVIYAADIGFADQNGQHDGKPERDPECETLFGEINIPKKIVDRYIQPDGFVGQWELGIAFRMTDGSIRVAFFTIEADVKPLSLAEIREFYLADSAAGLALVEYFKKKHPHTIFRIKNKHNKNEQAVEVDLKTAEKFIIDKVPPAGVLMELLAGETTAYEIKGSQVGLVNIALTQLLLHATAQQEVSLV